jgi:hypothetical protein
LIPVWGCGSRGRYAGNQKLFEGSVTWRMAGIEKEIKKAAGGKSTGGKKTKKSGGSPEKKVAKTAKRLLK